MRRAFAFALAFACGGAAAQGPSTPSLPEFACRSHPGFDSGQVPVAAYVRATPSGRTYFHDDREGCPAGEGCARKAYLVESDEVIVDRAADGWACAWYDGTKSTTMGYLRAADLDVQPALSDAQAADWYGRWERIPLGKVVGEGADFLEITERGNVVRVDGEALWFGAEVDGERNVHTGEIDDEILDFDGATASFPAVGDYACAATFRLVGGRLRFPDSDQPGVPHEATTVDGVHHRGHAVSLRSVGQYLIADDNGYCGGVNVTFDGIYRRAPARKDPTR